MSKDITPADSVCPIYLEPLDPAQIEADQMQEENKQKELVAKAAAKKAVLDKLGLTADEVAALFA